MGFLEDGAAGGFIDAAALHADVAVFHQIDPADAVAAADFIELGQQFGRRETFAVDRDGVPRITSYNVCYTKLLRC